MEFIHGIAHLAAGPLGEDQVASAIFDLLRHRLDDLQRLAHVLPVHGVRPGTQGDLVEKRNVIQFFFQDRADGAVTGGGDCQHVKHTLVVGVEHKAPFRGDILLAGDGQLHIAPLNGPPQDELDVAVHFLLGILVRMLSIAAELHPGPGYDPDVFQNHRNDTVHNAALLLGSELVIGIEYHTFRHLSTFFRITRQGHAEKKSLRASAHIGPQ